MGNSVGFERGRSVEVPALQPGESAAHQVREAVEATRGMFEELFARHRPGGARDADQARVDIVTETGEDGERETGVMVRAFLTVLSRGGNRHSKPRMAPATYGTVQLADLFTITPMGWRPAPGGDGREWRATGAEKQFRVGSRLNGLPAKLLESVVGVERERARQAQERTARALGAITAGVASCAEGLELPLVCAAAHQEDFLDLSTCC